MLSVFLTACELLQFTITLFTAVTRVGVNDVAITWSLRIVNGNWFQRRPRKAQFPSFNKTSEAWNWRERMLLFHIVQLFQKRPACLQVKYHSIRRHGRHFDIYIKKFALYIYSVYRTKRWITELQTSSEYMGQLPPYWPLVTKMFHLTPGAYALCTLWILYQ